MSPGTTKPPEALPPLLELSSPERGAERSSELLSRTGADGLGEVASAIARFLTEHHIAAHDRILVAFSGGPDSTALLHALIASRLRGSVFAAHLDHGLDEDSSRRAAHAERVCRQLEIPHRIERCDLASRCGIAVSVEAVAREHRYRFLERVRCELGAALVATAHHADDQLETLLLRMLQGSGWQGLAGIAPRNGTIVRPVLRLRRSELRSVLETTGAPWRDDPTNRTPTCARNRLRQRLLPRLFADEQTLAAAAAAARSLSSTVRRTRSRFENLLPALLSARRSLCGGASLDLQRLLTLPHPLRDLALDELHRFAGRPYPPGAARRQELWRQLAAGRRVGCDCGAGWRWAITSHRLTGARLVLRAPRTGPERSGPQSDKPPESRILSGCRPAAAAPWLAESARGI